MCKCYLLFVLSILSNTVLAQDYISYYLLCNDADSLIYVGKEQAALETYKQAFEKVDFVHSEKLKKAYTLAIGLDSFDLAYEYGKGIIRNSGQREWLKTAPAAFKKTNHYRLLADSSDYLLTEYNKRVNQEYIRIIDSLTFVDQYLIRKNKEYKADYSIDASALPENLFELDSANWQLLYACIQEMGFPSERNVGLEAYEKAWAILHHNLRLKENEKFHTEIFTYVRNGDYLPESMMVWYEQFYLGVYGQTYFTTWDGDISPENLQRVDANRRMFYLKGIHSFELKKEGRFMNAKW